MLPLQTRCPVQPEAVDEDYTRPVTNTLKRRMHRIPIFHIDPNFIYARQHHT